MFRDSLASKRSYSVAFRSAQGGLRAGIGTLEASASEICSVMSDSLQPHGLYSPWNSPSQNTGVGSLSFPSPGDLPNPGVKPRSPTLQEDSLPTEPPGRPKNIGMDSLSLL